MIKENKKTTWISFYYLLAFSSNLPYAICVALCWCFSLEINYCDRPRFRGFTGQLNLRLAVDSIEKLWIECYIQHSFRHFPIRSSTYFGNFCKSITFSLISLDTFRVVLTKYISSASHHCRMPSNVNFAIRILVNRINI